MGEFHNVVSMLLDAFAQGLLILGTKRKRKRAERLDTDPAQKTIETHLSKSLRRGRADVKEAYGRDLGRIGPQFATGDGK